MKAEAPDMSALSRPKKRQSENQRLAHLRKVVQYPRSPFQGAVCTALLARRQTLGEFAAAHFPDEPPGTINEAIRADWHSANWPHPVRRERIRVQVAEILGIDHALAAVQPRDYGNRRAARTTPRRKKSMSVEEYEWALAGQVEDDFPAQVAADSWNSTARTLRLYAGLEEQRGNSDRAAELHFLSGLATHRAQLLRETCP